MSDELMKIKKQIESVDFYLWLFGRYKGKTAEYIVGIYLHRKAKLTDKYIELLNKRGDYSEDI